MCQARRSFSNGSKQRGFTLAEVMISMTIFLIASMGLLPLLITNIQVNRNNNLHGQAQRLAGEVMTSLQLHDFEQLSELDGQVTQAGPIEIRREIISDTPGDGQSQMTVVASWQQRGRIHSYLLQSWRSSP
ncbi:MAG: hypothetical protein C0614_07050 [Desulfuromonas sp.]|nr:MAG: hypothetical protein C0614_07050 [Desulfuromonas sp.]